MATSIGRNLRSWAGRRRRSVSFLYETRPQTNPAPIVRWFFEPAAGGTLYTASVSETIALSEVLVAAQAMLVALGESPAYSESLATTYAGTASVNETVSLAESISAARLLIASVSETVTLSEAVITGLAYAVGLSETVSVAELIGAIYTARPAPSETVALSESVGTVAVFGATLAEALALAEQIGTGLAYTVSVNESVALAETVGTGLFFTASVSESVGLTEAIGTLLVILPRVFGVAEILATLRARAEISYAVTGAASAMGSLVIGSTVRLKGTFTDAFNNPYVATDVRLTLERPTSWESDVRVESYETPLVLAPGVYYTDLTIEYPGRYTFRFEVLDPGSRSACEGSFVVQRTLA